MIFASEDDVRYLAASAQLGFRKHELQTRLSRTGLFKLRGAVRRVATTDLEQTEAALLLIHELRLERFQAKVDSALGQTA